LKHSPEEKKIRKHFGRDSREIIEAELGEKSFIINSDGTRSKVPRNNVNGDKMIIEHPTIDQRHQEAINTSVVFKLKAQFK
jgi:hypothetical protein